jgi:hypothetical protein
MPTGQPDEEHGLQRVRALPPVHIPTDPGGAQENQCHHSQQPCCSSAWSIGFRLARASTTRWSSMLRAFNLDSHHPHRKYGTGTLWHCRTRSGIRGLHKAHKTPENTDQTPGKCLKATPDTNADRAAGAT